MYPELPQNNKPPARHKQRPPAPLAGSLYPAAGLSPDVEARLADLADQLYNVDHVTGEIVTHPPARDFPAPYTAAWWTALRRIDQLADSGRRHRIAVDRQELIGNLIDMSVASLEIAPETGLPSRKKQCRQVRGCRLRFGHAGICGKRLGPSVPTTGPLGKLPSRRRDGAPGADPARTSLVTPHICLSTQEAQKPAPKTAKKPADFCPDAVWSWEYHTDASGTPTARRRKVVPCGRWKCEPCRGARLVNELSPEIQANMALAVKHGWTLKLLTLTFDGTEPAGLNNPEGARLRTLELQHFIQWQRRRSVGIEYLRVAESHKNGRIHLHLLIVMPFVRQRVLQARWGRRVDIRPVFARCPKCWPDRDGSDTAKKRAQVILRGGSYSCANGHTMNSDQAQRRFGISAAWEIGKYLTKQSDIGRMSRSRNWIKAVPAMPADDGHQFRFGGSLAALATGQGREQHSVIENVQLVAYQLEGGERCTHWGDGLEWVELGAGEDVWITARGEP